MKISPLAPAAFPVLPTVKGMYLATISAGLRYRGRDDLMLAVCNPGSTVAGVFTRSLCPAAPIDWCQHALKQSRGRARAIICNAGNANAFTGSAGYKIAQQTAESVAASLGLTPEEVLVASTGVIAELLNINKIISAVPDLVAKLSSPQTELWKSAAEAIGTTDTYPKGSAVPIEGSDAWVVGFAKGSGMISPDMATMLAFIFTDLALDAQTAQECLKTAAEASFNRITVDSDTSTSDMALLFATGASKEAALTDAVQTSASLFSDRTFRQTNKEKEIVDEDLRDVFQDALNTLTLDLAHQIVRDGEGATKFVAVTVSGAENDKAAEIIAKAVADSPLVKTALAASDANWGRIVAAVGKAGQRANRDQLAIWIGDEQCAEAGMAKPGYSEELATQHLQGENVELTIDVGVAEGKATVWTCDLTHDYIDINAGYRS